MATTLLDLHHCGAGGSHDHLLVAEGTRVVFTGVYENRHGQLMAVFQVDDQDSPWHGLDVLETPSSVGITVVDLSFHIRFDSVEEHALFQQALTAHHLGNIAASLGNLEGRR